MLEWDDGNFKQLIKNPQRLTAVYFFSGVTNDPDRYDDLQNAFNELRSWMDRCNIAYCNVDSSPWAGKAFGMTPSNTPKTLVRPLSRFGVNEKCFVQHLNVRMGSLARPSAWARNPQGGLKHCMSIDIAQLFVHAHTRTCACAHTPHACMHAHAHTHTHTGRASSAMAQTGAMMVV